MFGSFGINNQKKEEGTREGLRKLLAYLEENSAQITRDFKAYQSPETASFGALQKQKMFSPTVQTTVLMGKLGMAAHQLYLAHEFILAGRLDGPDMSRAFDQLIDLALEADAIRKNPEGHFDINAGVEKA